MIIRNGVFILYNGYQLSVTEKRVEVPVPDAVMEYLIYFVNNNCPFKDFIKSKYNGYYKAVYLKDLNNAFSVETYGIFKGKKVRVFEKKLDNNSIVNVVSQEKSVALELNMLELNPSWFIKDVNVNELEEIWEERAPALGLKMPEGLAEKEIIKLTS